MSGRIKEKIDAFLLPCDFFHERSTKQLKRKFGLKGIAVYLYIRGEIGLDKGYYTELNDDFIFDVADTLDISEELVHQVIEYLVDRSLLNRILIGSVNYVTSAECQDCFQKAKTQTGAKRDIPVDGQIWLLKKSETAGFIKVCPETGISMENSDFSMETSDNSVEESTREVKRSKEKKSEVKRSEAISQEVPQTSFVRLTPEQYNALTQKYPKHIVDEYIRRVSDYCQSKGRNYSDYVMTISRWIDEDVAKGKVTLTEPSHDVDEWTRLMMTSDPSMFLDKK